MVDDVMHQAGADTPSSGHKPLALRNLAERARGHAEAASSANTRKAYAADWKHYAGWCRRAGLDALFPDPQILGLYVTARASGTKPVGSRKNAASTIERRLSALVSPIRNASWPLTSATGISPQC